ncbi:uncharacterized protein BJ171DRAFT_458383 [Polychytrium aggregatum]|uniref:uncharacterized protein n=1 Tax=Polychytrium aggregatum TaxID=110093 RepID=UPI0022FE7EA2|nr:uncharacterized protein BJ171DRAFT_458383 [Polychytrium aggregatum]KAI9205242.1 hypothetical protein BJ171DRAFT_458383 [Polychytrium aggregatum]
MSSAAGSEPFQCPTHGPKHAFFLSHWRSSDEQIARDLKRLLASVGQRRHGEPISVFLDSDCLDGTAGVSTDALPGSAVAVLLVSKSSMNGMKELADQGEPDSVVDEIRTALDLKDAKPDLPVLPLCIATLEDGGYIDFKPYMMSFPSDPKFASLKHTIDRMNQIQMYGFRPDQPHKRLYRLLTLFSPIFSNPGLRDAIPTKYYVDNLFLGDMGHLDSLLRQVTLTGRAVVSGMGGMGKSVLARQFLQFMMGTLAVSNDGELDGFKLETVGIKPQYSRIYWVNCATESTALDSLVDIFPHIKPGEIKQHASRILSQSREYLLVFDNVDDMAVVDSVFEHSVAAGFSGDVVVTTRLSALDEGPFLTALGAKLDDFQQAPLRLESWKSETAFDYILATSPMIAVKVGTDQDRATLRKLMDRINGYPLVIQTVRIYAECNDTPIDEIEAQFAQALEEQDGEDETRSSLKVIVDLSMSTLLKKGAVGVEACRLFGAISLLAPDDIPLELITAIAQKMELSADAAHFVKMVCESGLLRPGPDEQYYTHSLTQRVAHEWVAAHTELNSDRIEDATGEALLELTQPEDRSALALSKHLDQYVEKCVPECYTKPLHSQVEFKAARLSQQRAQYSKASETYQRSMERSIQFYGGEDREHIARILGGMGETSIAQGRFGQALQQLERALGIYVKVFGTRERLEVATILNAMGLAARFKGCPDRAIEYLQETRDLRVKVLGTQDHPEVATVLNNMGLVHTDQGRPSEALALYQESLEVWHKIPNGRKYADFAATLSNLGNAASAQGRLNDALELYQQSIDIWSGIFGTREHFSIATALNNMGGVAKTQARWDVAIKYFQESLDIKLKIFGTREHFSVATTLFSMALVAAAQGRLENAYALGQECLDIKVKVYGTRQHAEVAEILDGLGTLQRSRGRLNEALVLYRECLDIRVKVLGTRDHPDVATTLNNMGLLAAAQGQYATALKLYQECLDIKVKVFGTRAHLDVATVLNNMGGVAQKQGRLDDALAFYQESVDIWSKIPGSRADRIVATTLLAMGNIASSLGYYDRAQALFQESVEIHGQITESNDSDIAEAAHALGTDLPKDRVVAAALRGMAMAESSKMQYSDAREHAKDAAAILSQISPAHPDLESVTVILQEVAEKSGEN